MLILIHFCMVRSRIVALTNGSVDGVHIDAKVSTERCHVGAVVIAQVVVSSDGLGYTVHTHALGRLGKD